MEEFNYFIYILDRLLAPDGCPWDREQTLDSLRHSLVEETYELIEAIDLNDNQQIQDELGDLLLNVIFMCKLAEKEGKCTLQNVLNHLVAKLIRRHPHIFGEVNLKTSEEVLKQWEEIKSKENKNKLRHSTLDGIPKDLPTLARAQKVAKKLERKQFVSMREVESMSSEEKAGELLWQFVQEITKKELQPEQALRKRLSQIEAEFRDWEKNVT